MLGSQVYASTQYAVNARHVLYPVSSILRITLVYAYNIGGVLGWQSVVPKPKLY